MDGPQITSAGAMPKLRVGPILQVVILRTEVQEKTVSTNVLVLQRDILIFTDDTT